LHIFSNSYCIKSCVLHGEAGSANEEGIELARKNLRLLLQEGGYETENVCNQDESGAFWRQMPTHTLATGKRAGSKKEKERATFSLCCNATGTHKMGLLVIWKAARPRSFPKSVQPKRDLNLRYAHNKTAWMTAAEYGSWVRGVNSEMKRCMLQVLQFVHACSLAALIGAMLLQSILTHPCLEHKNVPFAVGLLQHKTCIDLKLIIFGCARATAAACC
jgi:hypothetical protein